MKVAFKHWISAPLAFMEYCRLFKFNDYFDFKSIVISM